MTLRCQVAQGDAVGTTTGSPETVGTITLPKDTAAVHAIMYQAVSSAVMTTAEALLGTFLFDSADLGIQNWERDAHLSLGGAPATNEMALQSPLVIVPVNISGELDSVQIVGQYEASAPEPTSDAAAQFFIVSSDSDGLGPNTLEALHKFGGTAGRYPFITDNWYNANDDEIGDALAEQMDDSINVEAKYNYVTSYDLSITPDSLLTDDEHILGFVEIESGVSGVQRQHQQWPIPALNPELGAAVGAPVHMDNMVMPLWINKGGSRQQFDFTINLQAVTTGANAVNMSLGVNK